jgi:hypothetical protein
MGGQGGGDAGLIKSLKDADHLNLYSNDPNKLDLI